MLNNRTGTLTKSILFLTFYRGLNIFISFLLVPLTIDYVNSEQYGIWLTLSSIIAWMSVFDIGLGNGLRNILSESIALNNTSNLKEYVSTSYIVLFAISSTLFILFLAINQFLNWEVILKVNDKRESMKMVVNILALSFCIRFFVQNISTIFFSLQKSEWVELTTLGGNVLTLISIYILTVFFEAKLLYLVFAISFPPIIAMIVASHLFFKENGMFRISFNKFNKSKIRPLFSLGSRFFVLQLASLISYSLTNIIILRLLGANEVTKYNVVYKYFSIIILISSIICTPLWSIFTDAFVKRDYIWIKKTIKKMVKIWFIIAVVALIMLVGSNLFFKIWLGKVDLDIPFSLSIILCFFSLVAAWNGIFVAFINGIGKVKLQMYLSFIPMLFTIPIAYYFVKSLHWGISGIAATMLIFNFISSVTITYQAVLIINKKDKGIWTG